MRAARAHFTQKMGTVLADEWWSMSAKASNEDDMIYVPSAFVITISVCVIAFTTLYLIRYASFFLITRTILKSRLNFSNEKHQDELFTSSKLFKSHHKLIKFSEQWRCYDSIKKDLINGWNTGESYEYVRPIGIVQVAIIEAFGLPASDFGVSSDPYCIVTLTGYVSIYIYMYSLDVYILCMLSQIWHQFLSTATHSFQNITLLHEYYIHHSSSSMPYLYIGISAMVRNGLLT
jgi:hypothetical protein